MNRKSRTMYLAGTLILVVWLAAFVGYLVAQTSKMTVDRVRAYSSSMDLSKMSAAERARAIHHLAEMVNQLPLEERRRWRLEGAWRDWFGEMTEEERARFIEETLPTGFKQMMDAFEQLPDERRKKALEDIMKRLRETHKLVMDREPGSTTDAYGTNGPPPFSPEQEKRILAVGLKTFYSTSSAQTKAEVAPLLEELQHQLEAGRGFR